MKIKKAHAVFPRMPFCFDLIAVKLFQVLLVRGFQFVGLGEALLGLLPEVLSWLEKQAVFPAIVLHC